MALDHVVVVVRVENQVVISPFSLLEVNTARAAHNRTETGNRTEKNQTVTKIVVFTVSG